MKNLTMNTAITENGYSCTCDLLPGWVVANSGSFEEFMKEVCESIDFYKRCAIADGEEYPSLLDEEYEIKYKFNVRSLLEHYRGIFSFSALQTITGINQKQLAHYASGVSTPREQSARKIAEGLQRLASELSAVTV